MWTAPPGAAEMRRAARCAAAALAAALLFTCTGCWNNRPIADLSIVVGAGYDKTPDGKINLTAQIVVPSRLGGGGMQSGGQNAGNAYVNLSAQGETAFDCVRNLLASLHRRAYFSHVRLLAFGSDFAREDGLSEVWDFMERDIEFSRMMRVTVVKDGTAQELLNTPPDAGKMSATQIADIVDNEAGFGKSVSIPSYKATELFGEKNTGTVINLISLGDAKSVSRLDNTGAAVIQDGKFIGSLDGDLTRGYLFGQGGIESAVLVVPNPEEPGKRVSVEVIHSTVERTVEVQNGQPRYSIRIQVRGSFGEEQGKQNLVNDGDIRKMEEECTALVKQDVERVLAYSQKDLHSDIFRLNRLLYHNDYAVYRKLEGRWREAYAAAPVSVAVDFLIERSGLVKRPAFGG